MPQTRFVLNKALEQNLRPILFINKIDKKDARNPIKKEDICLVELPLVAIIQGNAFKS